MIRTGINLTFLVIDAIGAGDCLLVVLGDAYAHAKVGGDLSGLINCP